MPFKFKLAARVEPLWNGKAANSRVLMYGQQALSREHRAFVEQPLETAVSLLSCSIAGYFLGPYRILNSGQFRNSERIWLWKKFSRFPRAKRVPGIHLPLYWHCSHFLKSQVNLTPNSLHPASGHSKEKREHWKLRIQIWSCHRITTVLAVSISGCCNNSQN